MVWAREARPLLSIGKHAADWMARCSSRHLPQSPDSSAGSSFLEASEHSTRAVAQNLSYILRACVCRRAWSLASDRRRQQRQQQQQQQQVDGWTRQRQQLHASLLLLLQHPFASLSPSYLVPDCRSITQVPSARDLVRPCCCRSASSSETACHSAGECVFASAVH